MGGSCFGSPTITTLPAARKRADRVFRLELGGFVHHDEIELQLAGREILGNRQRPHHEARLERHQRVAERCISWRMGMWRFCLLISFVTSAISVQVRTGPLWFP